MITVIMKSARVLMTEASLSTDRILLMMTLATPTGESLMIKRYFYETKGNEINTIHRNCCSVMKILNTVKAIYTPHLLYFARNENF